MDIRILVIIAIFAFIISDFWNRRKILLDNEGYDERQKVFIGEGFKYAMITSFGLSMLLGFVNSSYPDLLSVTFILNCLTFLPLMVLAVTAILNDAYYPVKIRPRTIRLRPKQGVIVSILFSLVFLALLSDGNDIGFFQEGGNGTVFLLLIVSISLALTFLYKIWKDKKEEEERCL